MAQHDHLRLLRLPETLPRRKRSGFAPPANRDHAQHGSRLTTELAQSIDTQKQRRPSFVDPALLLRVELSNPIPEEEWNKLGLTVVSTDPDRTVLLFSSGSDLEDFRTRLTSYTSGPPAGQKNPPYSQIVSNVESIGDIRPRDRIGKGFRSEGITEPSDFEEHDTLTADLELWDIGSRDLREGTIARLARFVESERGEVLDTYIGPSISMFRVRAHGRVFSSLLNVDEIASIDTLPTPDLITDDVRTRSLDDLPEIAEPVDELPLVGIIDTGVNEHPLLKDLSVGAVGVPNDLGTADVYGHGTKIAGIAAFGDLRHQIGATALVPFSRICSAKVVNDRGEFDERQLVPTQMRSAIETLRRDYNCRVFVVSLGHRDQVFDGGKVGPWSATLDELARELDVVIVVSAGNRDPSASRSLEGLEETVSQYPSYLTDKENRLVEPATAVNVLTVGSLSHGTGISSDQQGLEIRPITAESEPSPFTRIGPGVRNSVKPDFVDHGGTLVFDPVVAQLRGGDNLASTGILTLSNRPVDQLFTAASGTSYAAPLVALKAGQIQRIFPDASANLIRSFLGISARVTGEATDRLMPLGKEATLNVCGNGLIDLSRGLYSDDSRVVLYTEDRLDIDHFAVYEIPIPEMFQETQGERNIKVSLAFDPPVRHTRADYSGVGMNFRLIRGCDESFVFDHFRKRNKDDNSAPELANRYNCKLYPGPQIRDRSTLQVASASFKQNISSYGDRYFLVVRCEGAWASELVPNQSFAVSVELSHSAQIRLYGRIRQRIRV